MPSYFSVRAEKLIFLGKNGYATQCEDGALDLPMVPSPTGRMMISRDHYSEEASDNGHVVYNTDHAVEIMATVPSIAVTRCHRLLLLK